jgi:hypothetical protein
MEMRFTSKGDRRLLRAFSRLSGREMRLAMVRGGKAAMKPVLRDAREKVPVQSGKLQASLGLMSRTTAPTGTVEVEVAPRRRFSYQRDGGLALVGGGNKSRERHRNRLHGKHRLRGLKDRSGVAAYALAIETGRRKDGRSARKAGGAWYMRDAFRDNVNKVTKTYSSHIGRAIHRILASEKRR